LKEVLAGMDMYVMQYGEQIKNADGSQTELERYSELMLQWAHQLIGEYKQ